MGCKTSGSLPVRKLWKLKSRCAYILHLVSNFQISCFPLCLAEKWKDLQLIPLILWQNILGLRCGGGGGGELLSTFKSVKGSFCPEGGNVIKHGRALDGGCLVQNGPVVFHTGFPSDLLSYFSGYTFSACPHNLSCIFFPNFYSEK